MRYRSKKHVITQEKLFKILPSAVKVIKKERERKEGQQKSKKQSQNKRQINFQGAKSDG